MFLHVNIKKCLLSNYTDLLLQRIPMHSVQAYNRFNTFCLLILHCKIQIGPFLHYARLDQASKTRLWWWPTRPRGEHPLFGGRKEIGETEAMSLFFNLRFCECYQTSLDVVLSTWVWVYATIRALFWEGASNSSNATEQFWPLIFCCTFYFQYLYEAVDERHLQEMNTILHLHLHLFI